MNTDNPEIGIYQKQFKNMQRVKWILTDTLSGTGVVLGKGLEGIVDLYIIGLDKQIEGSDALAILVPSPALFPLEEGK